MSKNLHNYSLINNFYFQEVVGLNKGKSVVLSAFSVLSPLAQLALASEGASHDEILKTIGLPNDNVVSELTGENPKRLAVLCMDLFARVAS